MRVFGDMKMGHRTLQSCDGNLRKSENDMQKNFLITTHDELQKGSQKSRGVLSFGLAV